MNPERPSPIAVAGTVVELRGHVAAWRTAGESVALVPTMGALHEGHLSLVRMAREQAERVVVSIFVNPTQFSPNEDLARYPRTFEADCAALGPLADLVFAPAAETMYPPGSCTMIQLEGPATAGLEDRFRPTHFTGVATVVAKLLVQCLPDVAIFGEKDYQQLKVIMRMAQDLFLPVRILGGRDGARGGRPRHVLAQPLSGCQGARRRSAPACADAGLRKGPADRVQSRPRPCCGRGKPCRRWFRPRLSGPSRRGHTRPCGTGSRPAPARSGPAGGNPADRQHPRHAPALRFREISARRRPKRLESTSNRRAHLYRCAIIEC